jgi:hypothetical protein
MIKKKADYLLIDNQLLYSIGIYSELSSFMYGGEGGI